jgi:uncharacterized protein YqjF (DUF2071 family)
MIGMDRTAPRARPSGAARGHQRWRDLLFLHWPVPEAALRPLVPARLAIDRHEGTAYVGVVAFAMEGVRPAWLPAALGMSFLETNVRTYVHCEGRDPGVYFFSLDAASRLAVAVARAGWGLPYHHAAMALRREGGAIAYESRRRRDGAGMRARCEVGAPLGALAPGSLEFFLVERYILYVARGERLRAGRVHHAPYDVRAARVGAVEESLIERVGIARPPGPPPLAHYAPGVDVEIFGLADVE